MRKQCLPAAGKTINYYKDVRLMLARGERLDCRLPFGISLPFGVQQLQARRLTGTMRF